MTNHLIPLSIALGGLVVAVGGLYLPKFLRAREKRKLQAKLDAIGRQFSPIHARDRPSSSRPRQRRPLREIVPEEAAADADFARVDPGDLGNILDFYARQGITLDLGQLESDDRQELVAELALLERLKPGGLLHGDLGHLGCNEPTARLGGGMAEIPMPVAREAGSPPGMQRVVITPDQLRKLLEQELGPQKNPNPIGFRSWGEPQPPVKLPRPDSVCSKCEKKSRNPSLALCAKCKTVHSGYREVTLCVKCARDTNTCGQCGQALDPSILPATTNPMSTTSNSPTAAAAALAASSNPITDPGKHTGPQRPDYHQLPPHERRRGAEVVGRHLLDYELDELGVGRGMAAELNRSGTEHRRPSPQELRARLKTARKEGKTETKGRKAKKGSSRRRDNQPSATPLSIPGHVTVPQPPVDAATIPARFASEDDARRHLAEIHLGTIEERASAIGLKDGLPVGPDGNVDWDALERLTCS